jgi:hypothetical protein
MSEEVKRKTEPKAKAAPEGEKFYDAKFTIEAMQNEPFQDGFTWRSIVGSLFIAFVMTPGIIFMSLMIGQSMESASDWVVVIIFVEIARRSLLTLRKQELYILLHTVSAVSTPGMFAGFVWNRYLRNSEAYHNFGIAHQVPDWVAPYGDAGWTSFIGPEWWPALAVALAAMLLGVLTNLSLGFLVFKMTADAEKLPFPLAPIHAEGAVALAESQDKTKKGFRQYCFAVGGIVGAVFGIIYVAIPVLTGAILGQPVLIIPIPFLDLTRSFEHFMPGGMIGISLSLGLLFTGFVLPWKICVGMFATTITFQLLVNPILQRMGYIPHWLPGKDAIQTQVANSLDIYLSVGIGTGLAIFFVGVFGMVKALIKYARKQDTAGGVDIEAFWRRNVDRGDPPVWAATLVWVVGSIGFVALSNFLINYSHGKPIPEADRFSIWWLVAFAFFWTPLNTYITARMAGIAGQGASVPFLKEASIFLSQYRSVSIWFAPMPIMNSGGMADQLKVCELTRTKFMSLLKIQVLVIPLTVIASFIFWTYICSLGPIPSEKYPWIEKFWPLNSQMNALWTSSMQEGQSLLLESLKPFLIIGALVGTLGLFIGFTFAGVSTQYIYGGLGAMNGFPHTAMMIFVGACLGRFVLAKKFGTEKWQNFAPILAVGFGVGMGLVGMFSLAVNFLWVSIGAR